MRPVVFVAARSILDSRENPGDERRAGRLACQTGSKINGASEPPGCDLAVGFEKSIGGTPTSSTP
jgi:hypothetical protein